MAKGLESVPNATRYIVQISRLRSFPDGLTTTYEAKATSLLIDDLVSGRNYFWRVRPYNFFHVCTSFSSPAAFEVSESVTSITSIEGLEALQILPTIQKKDLPIYLSLQTSQPLSGNFEIIHTTGQSLYRQRFSTSSIQSDFMLSTNGLAAGVYLVGILTERGTYFKKIVLRD